MNKNTWQGRKQRNKTVQSKGSIGTSHLRPQQKYKVLIDSVIQWTFIVLVQIYNDVTKNRMWSTLSLKNRKKYMRDNMNFIEDLHCDVKYQLVSVFFCIIITYHDCLITKGLTGLQASIWSFHFSVRWILHAWNFNLV